MKSNYKIVLDTTGIKYEGEGASVDEALASLNLSWEHIKAKGVIKVSRGKQSYEHLFFLKQLKRIFANKTTRLMWGKRLQMLMHSKNATKNDTDIAN